MLLISSSICRNQRKHDKEKEIVESTATHRDVDDVEAVDIDDKQRQVTYHDSISITPASPKLVVPPHCCSRRYAGATQSTNKKLDHLKRLAFQQIQDHKKNIKKCCCNCM